jgi:hypothetical protein
MVRPVGFFADRSDDAYRKAADAVKAGTATKEQEEMNAQAAKQSGKFGSRARGAYKK